MWQCKVFPGKITSDKCAPSRKEESVGKENYKENTCNEQTELYENYTPEICEIFPFPQGT